MNIGRIFGLAILVSGAAAIPLAGCGDDETEITGSTASTGTAGTAGGAKVTQVRVAHLSPDAPAVDFCVRAGTAGAFTGPLMSTELATPAGLAYAQVTNYVEIPEGTYTVRLVAPGQDKCEPALAGTVDVTGVELATDQRTTVAVLGELTPPNATTQKLQVKAFQDQTSVSPGKARVTLINASPDAPAVDVGLVSGADFTAIFQNVAFGDRGMRDSRPYFETDPLTDVTIAGRPSGTTTDVLTLSGVNLPSGTLATVFVIGNIGGNPKPLAALVCDDTVKPIGAFSACLVQQ